MLKYIREKPAVSKLACQSSLWVASNRNILTQDGGVSLRAALTAPTMQRLSSQALQNTALHRSSRHPTPNTGGRFGGAVHLGTCSVYSKR